MAHIHTFGNSQAATYIAAGAGNTAAAQSMLDNEQPLNVNGLRIELVKWVMNTFAKFDTYKNGLKGVLKDTGLSRQQFDIELTYLFMAKVIYTAADLLSMRDITIENCDAPRRNVTFDEACAEVDNQLKEYGHSEVMGMSTNYACYEPWDNIFVVREELTKIGVLPISAENFGKLVKFLYDGYSN